MKLPLSRSRLGANGTHRKLPPTREVTVNYEIILPSEALDTLRSNNFENRNMSYSRARMYASLILSDSFIMSNDMIVFYSDGTMANGQHRYAGCVLANKPIKLWVARNWPRKQNGHESFLVIDQVKPKSNGFVLGKLGVASAATVSALCRNINTLEHSTDLAASWSGISAVQAKELSERYEEGLEFVLETIDRKDRIVRLTAPSMAPFVLAYQAGGKYREVAIKVGSGLLDLSLAPLKSPTERLARWLNSNGSARGAETREILRVTCAALYQEYMGATSIDRLRVSPGSSAWTVNAVKAAHKNTPQRPLTFPGFENFKTVLEGYTKKHDALIPA